MQPHIRSVNVGTPRPGIGARGRTSAIDKRPVASVEVRGPGPKRGGLGSGVVGDAIISRKHHGGTTQAVYAVAREELDYDGPVEEPAELARDLALDSMTVVVLAVALEDRFRIKLNEADAQVLNTVGDLVTLVQRRVQEQQP